MSLLDPKLQAFVAVVENRTVHGAAKTLSLSQTGVTQRIRALEQQLSTTLFKRSRSGMNMTSEGEALLRYCQRALELEGAIKNEISGEEKSIQVSITLAGPTSLITSRVIPICLGLYDEFPNLTLSYHLNDTESRSELLKKGIVELAVLRPEEVALEMDSKMLRPEKYILVASSLWKKRRTLEIIQSERIVDFYASDLSTQSYLKTFDLLSHARPDRIYANANDALITLIKHGVGYGTLLQEVAAPWLQNGELIQLNSGKVVENPIALAWYPRREMPKYFQKIIHTLK
jgi:LysR family transcriptional regulator (chromosome initiation inhibitor)